MGVYINGVGKESRVPLTICIVGFVITFFVNNDFSIRYIFNYIIVVGFIMCSLVVDARIRMRGINRVYFFLSAVVVIFSFLPNSLMDPESNNHAISIIVFFICCAMSMPSKIELNRSTKLLVISALLISVYTIMVKVMPDIYWNSIYPHLSSYTQEQAILLMRYHNYGVPVGGSANYADYILALGLFVCMGSFLSEYNLKGNKRRYILFSIVFLAGMVIQNRRSELLSTILTIILMYFISADFRYIQSKRFKSAIITIIIIVIGALYMYSRGMLDRYIDTFVGFSISNFSKIEEIGNGRIALWERAFSLFLDSPIVGIGWNQFRAGNGVTGMESLNVHNDYLQWLCETGIIGFALIAIPTIYIWIKMLSRCRRLFRGEDDNGEVKYYALIAFEIQTFFIIMHFFDPCFYKLLFWPMYAFSIILYNKSIYVKQQIGLDNAK